LITVLKFGWGNADFLRLEVDMKRTIAVMFCVSIIAEPTMVMAGSAMSTTSVAPPPSSASVVVQMPPPGVLAFNKKDREQCPDGTKPYEGNELKADNSVIWCENSLAIGSSKALGSAPKLSEEKSVPGKQ
jgi:hypothetical protein